MRDDDEKRLSLSDTPYDVASVDDIQNEDGGILKLPRVNALRRALAVLLVGIVAGCYLQAHAPMFSATSAFHPHCPSPPRKHADLYYGKTLAPANYTVVKGFFRQDEDDFDGEGYDLLKDGFGLLDKSAARWFKFAGYVCGGASPSLAFRLVSYAPQGDLEPQRQGGRAHYLQGHLPRAPRGGIPQRRGGAVRHARVELPLEHVDR